jgi:hypothetical protein
MKDKPGSGLSQQVEKWRWGEGHSAAHNKLLISQKFILLVVKILLTTKYFLMLVNFMSIVVWVLMPWIWFFVRRWWIKRCLSSCFFSRWRTKAQTKTWKHNTTDPYCKVEGYWFLIINGSCSCTNHYNKIYLVVFSSNIFHQPMFLKILIHLA